MGHFSLFPSTGGVDLTGKVVMGRLNSNEYLVTSGLRTLFYSSVGYCSEAAAATLWLCAPPAPRLGRKPHTGKSRQHRSVPSLRTHQKRVCVIGEGTRTLVERYHFTCFTANTNTEQIKTHGAEPRCFFAAGPRVGPEVCVGASRTKQYVSSPQSSPAGSLYAVIL